MMSVTDRAASILARTLREGTAAANIGFRVIPAGPGEIALTIDEVRTGDHVVHHAERAVLLAEGWVAAVFDGAVLDISEHEGGAALTLQRPNVPRARAS